MFVEFDRGEVLSISVVRLVCNGRCGLARADDAIGVNKIMDYGATVSSPHIFRQEQPHGHRRHAVSANRLRWR